MACLRTIKTALAIRSDGEAAIPVTDSDAARRAALEGLLTELDVRLLTICVE